MKRIILCSCIFFCIAATADAQAKKNALVKKSTAAKNITKKKKVPANTLSPTTPDTILLSNTSTNAALAPSATRLSIADPIINALNANAKGTNIKLSPSGLIGVPKGTYGFANGKLILYSNNATSTGAITGMGSVGTGSSIGNVGALGPAMGVNGKNPYAGVGSYGTRIPFSIKPITDTGKSIIIKRVE
jgi:hypothetical protein